MSKIYEITKAGKRVLKDSSLSEDGLRILQYLKDNKSASSDQLEVAGGERWLVRSLKRKHLIKELTGGE